MRTRSGCASRDADASSACLRRACRGGRVGLACARAARLPRASARDLARDMSSAEQSPIGQDGGAERQRNTRRAEHARNRTLRSALVAVPAASVNGAAAVSQRPAANGSLALVPPATRRPMRQVTDAARSPMMEPQDVRLLVTAAEAVRVFPFAGLSTADVYGRSGVAQETFERHLTGREACLVEAFEQALALMAERAGTAFRAEEGWLDRVRAGLLALLEFFDEEPALARYLVLYSA